MATYYWVGGSGTWDNSTTTNWATSSGGAGGAGFPTSTDNVVIDTSSGTGTITVGSFPFAANLTISASQSLVLSNGNITTFGNISISASTNSAFFNPGGFTSISTNGSANVTVNTNGLVIPSINIASNGGSCTLNSNLNCGSAGSGGSVTLISGTFNTNGYSIVADDFQVNNGTYTATLNLSTSVLTIYNQLYVAASAGALTISATSSTIVLAPPSGSLAQFTGRGFSYGTLVLGGTGVNTYTIQDGNNTFNTISNTNTSSFTLKFPTRLSTTINNFLVTGTPTQTIFLNNSTGAVGPNNQATLVKTGSPITNINYLNIRYMNGTPANTWYVGSNSVNVTFNTGLIFTTAYSDTIAESAVLADIDTGFKVTYSVIINEAISAATDIESAIATFSPYVSENLVVYDASTTVASFVSSVSEPTTLVNLVTSTGLYSTSTVENLALNDAEIGVKIHNASTDEPISVLYVTQCFGWGTIDNTESTQWVLIDNRQ